MQRVFNYIHAPVKGHGYRVISDAPSSISDVLIRIVPGQSSGKKLNGVMYRFIEGKSSNSKEGDFFVIILGKSSRTLDEFGRRGLEYNHAVVVFGTSEMSRRKLMDIAPQLFTAQYGNKIASKVEELLAFARKDDINNRALSILKGLFIGENLIADSLQKFGLALQSEAVNQGIEKENPSVKSIKILFFVLFFLVLGEGGAIIYLFVNANNDHKYREQRLSEVLRRLDMIELHLRATKMRSSASSTLPGQP